MKKFLQCNKGAAAIEMAIALPVFLMFTLVTMTFGHMYWVWNTMNYAANEGGRYVMAHTSASEEAIKERISNSLMGISSSDADVTISNTTVNGRAFKQINISYTYKFNVLKGLFGLSTEDLTATTLVPLYQPNSNNSNNS